ncbi:MAG: sulfatase [Planctomycetes bacterium]|nr:sulfatase [Planctomycetota bacterium]
MIARTTLGVAFLLVSCATGTAVAANASPERPPNLIFIFVDNLGYGDIGPFGSKVNRTPNLDRMAAEGTKFTHFYVSAGVCTPSRASLMTGCYAQRVNMSDTDPDGIVLRPVSPNGLNPNEITVAEILKERGYATTIIGKWHLGDQPPFLPTRQGFDSYLGIPYSDDMTARPQRPLWPPLPLMEDERVIEAPVDRNLLTKRYTERALAYIEANKNRPFFIYFPQAMPGSTRAPFASEAFLGQSANGTWGDSVEELDWSAGKVLDKLKALGIDRNTLVIWTSDNGAPTTGKPGDPSRGSNLPLFGRGYTTAEGAFRVPTIAWWPGKVPAGRVCEEMATSMDVLPTFAYLAGSKPPADRIIDGKDIRPLLFNEPGATTPHKVLYYYTGDVLHAVRSGPWKLFVPQEKPQRHPHHRKKGPSPAMLFNVVEDIGSRRNVAGDHPEIVERLMELAEKGRADLGDGDRPGAGRRPVGRFENPTARIVPSS